MSSVLIGIIGIALFMGIAIGSAIFLGPRFEDAQAQALGSNAVQVVSTVAGAVNSFRMTTGYAYGIGPENVTKLVTAGYLRGLPLNPVIKARYPVMVGSNGLDYVLTPIDDRVSWSPKYIYMSIGTDRAVCTQVMRMLGHMAGDREVDPDYQESPIMAGDFKASGCFRTDTSSSSLIVAGDYVVYSRIGGA